MGAINFSISRELLLAIQKEFQYNNFIETGTYLGSTAIWAADYFEKIYTIEIDHEISQRAFYNARSKSNISFIVGDSSIELKNISIALEGSNIYWLDGHWCQEVPKVNCECPLINELNSIFPRISDIVLIDDARFFMGIVPPPHNPSNWPRIDEILLLLNKKYPSHHIVIDVDIIMCLPKDVYTYFEESVRGNLIQLNKPEVTSQVDKSSFFLKAKNNLKQVVKYLLRDKSNNDGIVNDEYLNSQKRLIEYLNCISIGTLVDVGASHGSFIELVRAIHPSSDVIAFEPLKKVYSVLVNKFQHDSTVKLYNLAIGNCKGEIDFFANEYSFSSSVLALGERHIKEFPYAKSVSSQKIEINTLDELITDTQIKRPLFLKVDVQGLEKDVIEGSQRILSHVDYLLIEISFEELYEGQSLFEDINAKLNQLGLFYKGSFGQLYSKTNGQVLQADAIYTRS